MKKYYIHTIEGQPAAFVKRDGQICYMSHHGPRSMNLLVRDLRTIKAQQKASRAFREKSGFSETKYGYVTVFAP